MRRPLRSNRAITSPLRARSKASGLTRIRVRLTAGAPLLSFGFRRLFRGLALRLSRGSRGLVLGSGGLTLGGGLGPFGAPLFSPRRLALFTGLLAVLDAFATGPLGLLRQGGFAVGAECPAGIDGPLATRARVLEPSLALGTAQEVLLDRESAPRTRVLGQLTHAQLGRLDLQLAFVGV